jgi:AcrR family transcriptional regulator
MTAVAEAAGISQPALSQRFGSRQQLMLRALVPVGVPDWVAAIRRAPVEGDARATLRTLGEQGLAVLDEAVPCLLVLRAADLQLDDLLPAGAPAPHDVVAEAIVDWFTRAADAGSLSPGDAEARATAFVGTLQADAMRRWVARESAPADDARRRTAAVLVDALWSGWAPGGAA